MSDDILEGVDMEALDEALDILCEKSEDDTMITVDSDTMRRLLEPSWTPEVQRAEIAEMVGDHPPLTDEVIAEVRRLSGGSLFFDMPDEKGKATS